MRNYHGKILTETKHIAQKARHVKIAPENLNNLAEKISSSTESINLSWTDLDFKYHFVDGTEKTVQWLFLSSALNFSFWDGKAEELWKVEYDGEWVKGYWALTAALKKAVQTHDILNATYLQNITQENLTEILNGQGQAPLIEKRVQVCNNIGRTLNEKFDGQFANILKQSNKSATQLTNLVATHFEDFRDISIYEGIEAPILKRAQILAADIWGAFKGQSYGEFHDIDQLTIFADYKLPQFLNALGVLEYSDTLMKKIENYEILESGSDMEIELRALTIQAVEELKKATNNKFSAVQLDWWIWNNSFNSKYESKPHHLTRSVYY